MILGAIHSTKINGNFGPKLNGSVRSNRKSFEKTGPPFEVVLFSRSDRSEFWLNGSRPLSTWQFLFFRPKQAIIVAIIKTKSATIAFFSLLLLSSSSLCHFLLCYSFLGVILELISAVSAGAQQRSTEPAFGRLFTQMTVKFVTFLKKTAAVRSLQLRKKVLRLDATSYQSSDRTVQHLFMTTKWARVAVLRTIRTSPWGDERQWCPCLWTESHHSGK